MIELPLLVNSRIEISGWDASGNFFVERPTLESSRQDRLFVLLQHPPKDGALVFVRETDSARGPRQLPTAYRAEGIEPANGRGLNKVSLLRLGPIQRAAND